ncbi:MAG: RNA polymerase sigma factor [Candidatus Promineifilaceae bacterium]
MSDSLTFEAGLGSPALHEAPVGLIQRCLEGEEQAYLAVYNQYGAMIYRLCHSLLGHEQDAEEVLQDTFEYAFRKLAQFDARRASFKTWLYQIAISRCRNKRRRKWLPTLPLGQLRDQDLPDHRAVMPDDAALHSERQAAVWQALGRLSAKLREVAVLRYYEELTYAEIGAILSIPAKTAESRMRLAHAQLKKHLADDQRWTG